MVLRPDKPLESGMNTQLDFGSNMGEISPGYTFSFPLVCKSKRCQKRELVNNALTKELDLRTHFNIYFWFVSVYVCLGITVKHLTKKVKIRNVLSKNPGEHY